MDEEILPDDALELSVMAAMARQHETDARTFLRSLATLMESALPGEAVIQRSGLFGGDKRPVRRIEVSLALDETASHISRFAIEDSGAGPLVATSAKVVHGIALKTESIPVRDWIAGVAAGIARRAATNRATRNALAGLV